MNQTNKLMLFIANLLINEKELNRKFFLNIKKKLIKEN